jgi:monothiol glutaredoxin
MSEANQRIDQIVKNNDIVLFMKGTALFPQCGFSSRAVAILDHLGVTFETVDVLQDPEIRQGIKDYSEWPTVPQLYVKGRVRRRLGYHDGDVPGGRASAADRRQADRQGLKFRSCLREGRVPRKNLGGPRDRKVRWPALWRELSGPR